MVIEVDSVASVYKHFVETGEFDKNQIKTYVTEGIGEDNMPANIGMSLIDAVIQVGDKDAMVTTRKLAKQEALFVGGSCGAAVYGALEYVKEHPLKEEDIMVIILPESS